MPIQWTAADIIKYAMIQIDAYIREKIFVDLWYFRYMMNLYLIYHQKRKMNLNLWFVTLWNEFLDVMKIKRKWPTSYMQRITSNSCWYLFWRKLVTSKVVVDFLLNSVHSNYIYKTYQCSFSYNKRYFSYYSLSYSYTNLLFYSCFEILLYIGSWLYIDYSFTRADNQFIYWLTITGVGFIVALMAFFIAISLNHKHLYDSDK